MKKTIVMGLLLLSACSNDPKYSQNELQYIDAYKSASQGKHKLGKVYEIKGISYEPTHQPALDQTGVASWYGPGFHGRKTASGEIFNKNALTAAHPTLPLPSIVEVTNLDNGKQVVVRINDRGPFASERIIDLSKGAADELDMIKTGTANVRVKLLNEETLDYLTAENIMQ